MSLLLHKKEQEQIGAKKADTTDEETKTPKGQQWKDFAEETKSLTTKG